MFVEIYNWILQYFFTNVETLPTVVQGIVPELCTLLSVVGSVLVLALPLWLLFFLGRIVFSFGNFGKYFGK